MLSTRVARCSLCRKKHCRYSKTYGDHLLITHEYVDVKNGFAIAISYAWGHFDRQGHCIGHDVNGKAAMTELGKEWDLMELRDALRRFCNDDASQKPVTPGVIWLDQLCLPQEDESQVRAALAKIPDIFSNFDVVALQPGQACQCFLKLAIAAEEADDPRTSDSRRGELEKILLLQCCNLAGLFGWVTRLWTRQEMVHARRIHFVWTNDRFLKYSVEDPGKLDGSDITLADTSRLSLPARLWYYECAARYDLDRLSGSRAAGDDFVDLCHLTWKELQATVRAWYVMNDLFRLT